MKKPNADHVFGTAFRRGITPDPILTVSEWADEYRRLSSKASAEPGPWRTSRTPYLKEIMDSLSPYSNVERVVFMKGSQLGATECGNNWIGFVIHHTPGPMLSVLPTVEMAKRTSKQRLDPLIDESPALRERIKPARSRDSGNTILTKEFQGGVLILTGANSATGLRSMPVRFLFLDEIDAYPGDIDDEGDPVALAEARTRTFSRRKIFLVSTPTIRGISRIEREYEMTDQRRYFVPCPECGTSQWLKFEQLKWPKDQPELARYECEHCGFMIEEHHKTWMLDNGYWEATAEGDGKTAGFHLSSLYSPVGWRSWANIAKAWKDAQGSDANIKAFKNTELGETFVESGEAPDWQRLYDRREDYKFGLVRKGALFITAGADVQKDRIEVSVWGWGREKESWLVEHRVLEGDTSREDVWNRLTKMIGESWHHADGCELKLSRIAVDSGYATQEVYDWVRKQSPSFVIAVKGVQRGAALVGMASAVDTTADGKKFRRGIKIRPVCGHIAKLELFGNLRKNPPTEESGDPYPPGYVHLPKVDEEFVKQMCSEQLVTKRNRAGYAVREWQKTRERNEALDCYVYARAAASIYGLDRFSERHWKEMENHLTTTVAHKDDPKPKTTKPSGRRVRSRGIRK
ncbi:MAG: phage terminase large subunit family protein [Rhodospirillales bacterium]|nr:phage terminase large subunit family protein [Rhodospirillales bacterium]